MIAVVPSAEWAVYLVQIAAAGSLEEIQTGQKQSRPFAGEDESPATA